MKTYIYVDVCTLTENFARNGVSPPILVTGNGNNEAPRAGCRIKILGPCEIVYDKAGVLRAGAPHVAIVTEGEVEIIKEYAP